jgi:hypothetical protein
MMSKISVLFLLLFCNKGICPEKNCDRTIEPLTLTKAMKPMRNNHKQKSVLFVLLFCNKGICPEENCDQTRMVSILTMTMKPMRSNDEQKIGFISSSVL